MPKEFSLDRLSRRIQLQVYVLLAVLIATAGVLSYVDFNFDRKIEAEFEAVNDFHSPSLRRTLEAKESLRVLETHYTFGNAASEITSTNPKTALFLLEESVQDMMVLQASSADPRFENIIRKVSGDYTWFHREEALLGTRDDPGREALLRATRAFESSLWQLQRLHETVIDESGEKMKKLREADSRGVLYTLALVLSVGSVLVIVILFSLRRVLAGAVQTHRAKEEAERRLEEQRMFTLRSDRLRSLGEMATGVAHELNQPLMGVQGLAEHLLAGLERNWDLSSQESRSHLQKIVEQADRMAHIVEHVRKFSRQGEADEYQAIDLNEVVENGCGMLGAQFRSRGIELQVDAEKELPFVMGNVFSLEEVLINLLLNARDATEAASNGEEIRDMPPIRVRTYRLNGTSPGKVAMEVRDQGIGMPQDAVAQVFEAFYTTKGPEEGTGLGLSISKSIMDEHNGEISIESDVGVGTSVTVTMPAAEIVRE